MATPARAQVLVLISQYKTSSAAERTATAMRVRDAMLWKAGVRRGRPWSYMLPADRVGPTQSTWAAYIGAASAGSDLTPKATS